MNWRSRAYAELSKRDLVTWATLAFGYERGWVSDDDIAQHATCQIQDVAEVPPSVIALVDAKTLRPVELRETLEILSGAEPAAVDPRKAWQLALIRAAETGVDSTELLQRVEEIYAELGYPENMSACSMYYVPPEFRGKKPRVGERIGDPLEALQTLTRTLEREVKRPSAV